MPKKKPSSQKKSKQYAKPKTDKQRAKLLGTGGANKAAKAIIARKKKMKKALKDL